MPDRNQDCLYRQNLSESVIKFFDVPAIEGYVCFVYTKNTLTVSTYMNRGDSMRTIGVAKLDEQTAVRYLDAVRLFLPPEQIIFANLPASVKSLDGPAITQYQRAGTYKRIDTEIERLIFVQLSQSNVQIGGFFEGKAIPELFLNESSNRSGWIPVAQ